MNLAHFPGEVTLKDSLFVGIKLGYNYSQAVNSSFVE